MALQFASKPAGSSVEDKSSEVAILSAELTSARADIAGTVQRAVAAEAEVARVAAESASLVAQVKDLQAALHAASQTKKSPHAQSQKVVSASAELKSAQERSTAALQRAAAADVDVQTLTAQVKDLQMTLLKQPSFRAISKPESRSAEASFKHVCCQLSCQCSC